MKLPSTSRQIGIFLILAFGISWTVWLIAIKTKVRVDLLLLGTAGPGIAAAIMQGRSRMAEFRWWLFALLIPICWTSLVLANAAGEDFRAFDRSPILILPAVSAAFLTALFIRWPGWRWPLIAVMAMPAILLIPALIARFVGLPLVHPRQQISLSIIGALFLKQVLFAGMLEEPGWRGWLLPRLQERYSPLVASLFVWFPWALWHAPLDFTGGVGKTWINYIQVRVVFFIAITILMTWLYNRSRGSLLVVVLFHASFNTFPFVLPYSPPFLALIFVWAIWVVISDRMWRTPSSVT